MKVLLLINLVIAVIDLILVYSIAFEALKKIKSYPRYKRVKHSIGSKIFGALETLVRSLLPLYNIVLLLGLLFMDRKELVQNQVDKYFKELDNTIVYKM